MKNSTKGSPSLQFSMPFGYEVTRFGLLGIHANAFLHGVFDDVDRGCLWYDHAILRNRYVIRRESDLSLEAEWFGEWLALMRDEGATSLRLHFEDYKRIQQHYVIDVREHYSASGPRGMILSAWQPGLFGERCIASWTPVIEDSHARRQLRDRTLPFRSPVGVPAECSVYTMVRTSKTLNGARVPSADIANITAQLDRAFAAGKQAGYVMPELPDAFGARQTYIRDRYPSTAIHDTSDPVPAFFNDPMTEDARHVFVDAGILAGQLAQVPQLTPAHPYDDFNQGPIYASNDRDGAIYKQIDATIRTTGVAWLWLCFRPFTQAATTDPLDRLRLRTPWDIGFDGDRAALVSVVKRD
jgi:hypothetical protein